MKWIDTFADRIAALLGALLFSQIPGYYSQYMNRLTGHVTELRRLTVDLQERAHASVGDLHTYLNSFHSSNEPHIVGQGEFLQALFTRFDHLQSDLNLLQESTVWSRPFTFATHFDFEVGSSVLNTFEPSVTFSIETLAYAIAGFLFGIALYRCIKRLFRSLRSLITRKQPV